MKFLNMSSADRIIRTIVGIALLVLRFANVFSGGLGWLALILGIVLTGTGVVGFCPLYALLRIRTNKAQS